MGRDARLVNGKYICKTYKVDEGPYSGASCNKNKTIDGVANVCTCQGKTNGRCCRVYGNKCNCPHWAGECLSSENVW